MQVVVRNLSDAKRLFMACESMISHAMAEILEAERISALPIDESASEWSEGSDDSQPPEEKTEKLTSFGFRCHSNFESQVRTRRSPARTSAPAAETSATSIAGAASFPTVQGDSRPAPRFLGRHPTSG